MEAHLLQTIQTSLLEKRDNLINWLKHTPESTKSLQLGSEKELAVQNQIDQIDRALGKVEDKTMGRCEICHEDIEAPVLEMDYTARICLEHFSDQERQQLESELEFIQVIQRALLPQQVPDIPGLDLAVFSRPAQIVSGDYFDFFQYKDGSHGWVVADAMGHGISASLITSGLQSALRILVPENKSRLEYYAISTGHFSTISGLRPS